jgi:hypothetical protein
MAETLAEWARRVLYEAADAARGLQSARNLLARTRAENRRIRGEGLSRPWRRHSRDTPPESPRRG